MKNDQLERFLADDEIVPSAGFTASVMDAVRREAAAPPPIAFPWKRALPGLAASALTLALVLFVVGAQVVRGAPTPPPAWAAALRSLMQAGAPYGALWVGGALLLSFLCIKLSLNYGLRGA